MGKAGMLQRIFLKGERFFDPGKPPNGGEKLQLPGEGQQKMEKKPAAQA